MEQLANVPWTINKACTTPQRALYRKQGIVGLNQAYGPNCPSPSAQLIYSNVMYNGRQNQMVRYWIFINHNSFLLLWYRQTWIRTNGIKKSLWRIYINEYWLKMESQIKVMSGTTSCIWTHTLYLFHIFSKFIE